MEGDVAGAHPIAESAIFTTRVDPTSARFAAQADRNPLAFRMFPHLNSTASSSHFDDAMMRAPWMTVDALHRRVNRRFTRLGRRIDVRFKESDQRIDARFKESDQRIDARFKESE